MGAFGVFCEGKAKAAGLALRGGFVSCLPPWAARALQLAGASVGVLWLVVMFPRLRLAQCGGVCLDVVVVVNLGGLVGLGKVPRRFALLGWRREAGWAWPCSDAGNSGFMFY